MNNSEKEGQAMKGQIVSKKAESHNSMATALKLIAWVIIICGIIGGMVLAKTRVWHDGWTSRDGTFYPGFYIDEFSWTTALIYWVASVISGTLFLGFAEIISLLQALVNKKEYSIELNEAESEAKMDSNSEKSTETDEISQSEEEKNQC